MPHDVKGRLIEVGDHLKFNAWDTIAQKQVHTVGRVATVTPGSTSCNVGAYFLVPGYHPVQYATLTAAECELVLKADGSVPAVPGGGAA